MTNLLKQIKEYQRFKAYNSTYIIYNERGKLAMQDIFGGSRKVSLFNYPRKLRLFHLYLLFIFDPLKKHVPFKGEILFK